MSFVLCEMKEGFHFVYFISCNAEVINSILIKSLLRRRAFACVYFWKITWKLSKATLLGVFIGNYVGIVYTIWISIGIVNIYEIIYVYSRKSLRSGVEGFRMCILLINHVKAVKSHIIRSFYRCLYWNSRWEKN